MGAVIRHSSYQANFRSISLQTVWWALSNASLIVQIHPVIHEILANRDFTVTDDLISWLFVVTFVHPTYMQIALIWCFPVQLSLWKSVHWLWRYKLNKFCDRKVEKDQLVRHKDTWLYPQLYTYCPWGECTINMCPWYHKTWEEGKKTIRK